MIRAPAPFLALLFASAGSYAQPTAKPEFEVASIKPSPPPTRVTSFPFGGCHGGPGTNEPASFICERVTLWSLVASAYSMAPAQLSGPDWMKFAPFDIRGSLPKGATSEQLPVMLQNLLADRFRLAVHRERRPMQRYELAVGENGPKFNDAAPPPPKSADGDAQPGFMLAPPKLDKEGYPVVDPLGGSVIVANKARMHWPGMTMQMLASQLSGQLDVPVDDATGLAGRYDIDLHWTADNGLRASATTLKQVLQDQLGLRLESTKGPVMDFLVVDHAEKVPTEN